MSVKSLTTATFVLLSVHTCQSKQHMLHVAFNLERKFKKLGPGTVSRTLPDALKTTNMLDPRRRRQNDDQNHLRRP